MKGKQARPRPGKGPLRGKIETVHGEPYQIGERILTPVTRVLSYAMGQGTLGRDRMSGWGMGLVHATPVAVLVEGDGPRRRIPVTGRTDQTLRSMAVAALLVTLLLWGVRLAVRSRRQPEAAAGAGP